MSEREHEARRDELAAYLLGALEPGEAAAIEQHLAGCEECRAELEWLQPAVQVLPESVERVEPSAELRARIMGEIEADGGAAAKPPFARRRRWGLSLGLRPAAGLAVLALLIAMVAGYAIRDGGGWGGGEGTTVKVGKAPGVTAEMVREGDAGTLHLANLHPLRSDKVLQAWVQRGERIESAKTLFVPNPDGTATAVIDQMNGVSAVMVTAEPSGGSEQPTSKPIVNVAVTS